MQQGAELVFAMGTLEFMEQADDLLGSGDDTEPALLKGIQEYEKSVCAPLRKMVKLLKDVKVDVPDGLTTQMNHFAHCVHRLNQLLGLLSNSPRTLRTLDVRVKPIEYPCERCAANSGEII